MEKKNKGLKALIEDLGLEYNTEDFIELADFELDYQVTENVLTLYGKDIDVLWVELENKGLIYNLDDEELYSDDDEEYKEMMRNL